MSSDRVLIVDDERNIRLTVGQALERLDAEVLQAVTGEEALETLRKEEVSLVLLDLKMPGIDGMEVLRTLREKGNDVKVVVITAHGTVDNAVEAMKLGAVDFIQKPFTPDEIRTVTAKALKRKMGLFKRIAFEREVTPEMATVPSARLAPEPDAESYDDCVEQAKTAVEGREFDNAIPWARKAISVDPSRPEGYNLLGVLLEIKRNTLEAQKYYRAALSLDPTYEPAARNLTRTTEGLTNQSLDIGGRPEKKRRSKGVKSIFRHEADSRKKTRE